METGLFRPVLSQAPDGGTAGTGAVVESKTRLTVPRDIDNLIALLRRPTQGLTTEEYFQNMAQRQEAVDKFLLRGGSEALSRLFAKVKQLEEREPVKLDLSMLELSNKLLGGLYAPGVNAEKLVFTMSDISGSDVRAGNFNAVVAPRSIMRGIIATGSDWTDAVIPRADLSGGRFIGSTFINTDMRGAIVNRDTNFTGAVFIGTYVGGVEMELANTAGAVFSGLR